MNLVNQLRTQSNLTQQELAVKACTSQSTIAAYEAGTKSPTLRTVDRIAASLGLALFVTYAPQMTREDHRSLAFHRAIADILTTNSAPATRRAKQNLAKLTELNPHATSLFRRWSTWLDLAPEDLVTQILGPSLVARDMRQVSPFTGLLTNQDRVRILREFRKEYRS